MRGVGAEPDLDGLDDDSVLELAAADRRILVTRNARDFAPVCRLWAEAAREHSGVILVWSLSHHEFSAIAAGVHAWLVAIPEADDWRGLSVGI